MVLALTVVALLIAIVPAPTAARAGSNPQEIRLKRVARATGATAMAIRKGDPALYVTLQSGLVMAYRTGERTRTVLDLTKFVTTGGEQGLLGLTFSPDGDRLYVHYSGVAAGETVVEEYEFTGGRVDTTTRRVLLTVPQPQVNHNGGELVFGPDGYLHLALGDGGQRDDRGPGHVPTTGNGQSLNTVLGKILRIDPRPSGAMAYTVPSDNPFVGTSARAEILVYGLRNPWRFSFDTKTGDLWIADVGQDKWEEVTRVPADDIAGANLGWNLFEGTHRFRDGADTPVVMPTVETAHDDGNCSITGGYVYRGEKIPALRGWYLYTDYCNGDIMAVRVDGSGNVTERDLDVAMSSVSSFGQDANGELYVLSQDKGIFRVVPA